MKAAIYARVSSLKQAEKDLSIASQLKLLHEYALKNNYDIYDEYIDEAESARTADRPAFQRMIALAKQKQKPFDLILVWKLSRFARNREDSIIYKSILRKKGINVISINEKFDESPSGKLLEGIIEVMDEFYSANLAEEAIRGMKENASRGYRNGGRTPIGYKPKMVKVGKVLKSTIEIDKNFAPLIKNIFNMYTEDGKGAKEIAKTLNDEGIKTNNNKLWSTNTLYKILKNEVYIGTLKWGKSISSSANCLHKSQTVIIKNNHPKIIDNITFQKAQGLLSERNINVINPRIIKSRYLLSGMLFCGKCGYSMIGCSAKSGKFSYYACHNYLKKGKKVCNNRLIPKEKIESFVINLIKKFILTEENLDKLVKITNEKIKEVNSNNQERNIIIRNQINQLNQRIDNLFDLLETNKIDINLVSSRINKLREQIQHLKEEQRNINIDKNTNSALLISKEEIRKQVQNLHLLLNKGSFLEQKNFIRSFIRKIIFNESTITMEYIVPLKINKAETPSNIKEVLPTSCIG
jgi:site-specific DNA recombinase